MGDNNNQNKMLFWDLSRSNSVEQIGWPEDNTSDILNFNDVVIGIKLPGGYEINEWNASNVYVTSVRKPDIGSVVLRTQKMSLERAYKEAQRIAIQFQLDSGPIDRWYEQTRSLPRNLHTNFMTTTSFLNEDREEIAVTLESASSQNDEEPWIISLSIAWLSDVR